MLACGTGGPGFESQLGDTQSDIVESLLLRLHRPGFLVPSRDLRDEELSLFRIVYNCLNAIRVMGSRAFFKTAQSLLSWV